jgi:CheY-like chemotaxis protein
MMKRKILFIDDEIAPDINGPKGSYMWYYIDALKGEGFEVKEVLGPDEAIDVLCRDQKWDLIILDIMMLPGTIFKDKDTMNGILTGVEIARFLVDQYADIPVLVLTNLNNPTLRQKLKYKNIKGIFLKEKTTPYELVEEVKKI